MQSSDRPTVFIHTNHKQILGAIVSRYSMKRNSARPDAFDVEDDNKLWCGLGGHRATVAERPTSADPAIEQTGNQRGNAAALGALKCDVAEQRVALEVVDDRGNAIEAADAQVVALSDIVG